MLKTFLTLLSNYISRLCFWKFIRHLWGGNVLTRHLISLILFSFLVHWGFQASAKTCQLVVPGESHEITETLSSEQAYSVDIAKTTKTLENTDRIDSPIPVSKKMNSFRKDYLPYMRLNGATTEAIIRFMESDLRMKSLALSKKLLAQSKVEKYDLVIVGAGVHGVIAAQTALKKNSNYKILVIDSSDTAGSNFRYATDVFNINSSNRASGEDRLPLPGEGNINELPNLPIQVSDLSAVKYPTAGDLGGALVTGLYSATLKYPNIDVLFSSQVKDFKYARGEFRSQVKVPGGEVKIKSSRLSIATGVGTPRLPEQVAKDLRKDRSLIKTNKIEKALPRVITFENFIRALSQSSDPKKYIADKNISVVGVGDSANVTIEFMLGYAVDNAYGISNAQTLGPKNIYWIGQDRESCEEFIEDIRSRYAPIGTGFRSSSENVEAIIKPISNRLASVKAKGKKKVIATLEEEPFPIDDIESDVIVLATGYESQVAKLIQGLIPDLDESDLNLPINEFYEKYTSFQMGTTKVSDGQDTRIGRVVKVNRATNQKPMAVINGPAAGKLPQDDELVGIVQNSVSIFNNAPRTEASTKQLLKGVKAGKAKNKVEERVLKYHSPLIRSQFEVSNLSDVRTLPGVNDVYLKAVLSNLLTGVKVADDLVLEGNNLEINFYNGKNKVYLDTNLKGANVQEIIVDPLLATRDFFNMMSEILTLVSRSFNVSVPVVNGQLDVENLRVEYTNRARKNNPAKKVENAKLDLELKL